MDFAPSRSARLVIAQDRWIYRAIVSSAVLFIFILALAAVFDPTIRWLHLFQALIYVAVIFLAGERSAWGYGAGCIIAAFWNWTNFAHTQFISAGWGELVRLLKTGQITRPDLLIAVFAALAHFVLIGACIAGYWRMSRGDGRNPIRFVAGGVFAVASFAGMIILFGPQYVPLLRRVFGLA